MKALVVTEAGGTVKDITADLPGLNAEVGGYLEGITGSGWHAYVDEEAKLKGLPVNFPATLLARELGWHSAGDVLVGTVVFLGTSPGGDEARVPGAVLDTARFLGVLAPSE